MDIQENDLPAVDEDLDELTKEEERELLKMLCEQVFQGDEEKLAVALGRSNDEMKDLLNGEAIIDEDLVIKAHGLLHERAFE